MQRIYFMDFKIQELVWTIKSIDVNNYDLKSFLVIFQISHVFSKLYYKTL